MDEADDAPARGEPLEDDPLWAEAAPFAPELALRLDVLAIEVGVVDLAAPIVGPVVLGESGTH